MGLECNPLNQLLSLQLSIKAYCVECKIFKTNIGIRLVVSQEALTPMSCCGGLGLCHGQSRQIGAAPTSTIATSTSSYSFRLNPTTKSLSGNRGFGLAQISQSIGKTPAAFEQLYQKTKVAFITRPLLGRIVVHHSALRQTPVSKQASPCPIAQ